MCVCVCVCVCVRERERETERQSMRVVVDLEFCKTAKPWHSALEGLRT